MNTIPSAMIQSPLSNHVSKFHGSLIEPLEARIAPAVLLNATAVKLKNAISLANATPGADTIDIKSVLGSKITLSNNLPTITGDLTINWIGRSSSLLTIDGNNHQIFNIQGANLTVNLSKMKLTNANAAQGAAVNVDDVGGTVSLNNLTVFKNKATLNGGGIAIKRGTVTISDSKIDKNSAGEAGAGIFNSGGTVTLSATTVSNNVVEAKGDSDALGGGIFNSGTLKVINSSFITGNAVLGAKGQNGDINSPNEGYGYDGGNAQGGGLFNSETGAVTVVNSTISGNLAKGGKGGKGANGYDSTRNDGPGYGYEGALGGSASGGGVQNSGSLTIQTSTVSGNVAEGGEGGKGGKGGKGNNDYAGANGGDGGEGGYASGGGIYSGGSSATLTVSGSTISGNLAKGGAGGAGGQAGDGIVVYDGYTYEGYAGEGGEAGASIGGGVHSTGSSLDFSSVTVTGNTAGSGGGLSIAGNILTTIANSTIQGNTALEVGGGLFISLNAQSDPVNVMSSIIASNVAPVDADIHGTAIIT